MRYAKYVVVTGIIVVMIIVARQLLPVDEPPIPTPDGNIQTERRGVAIFGDFDFTNEPICEIEYEIWSSVVAIVDADEVNDDQTQTVCDRLCCFRECEAMADGGDPCPCDYCSATCPNLEFLCPDIETQLANYREVKSLANCSGVYVSGHVVATANHCIEVKDNKQSVASWIMDDASTYMLVKRKILEICHPLDPAKLDLVLLRVSGEDDNGVSLPRDIRNVLLLQCIAESKVTWAECVANRYVAYIGHPLGMPRGVTGPSSNPSDRATIKEWCSDPGTLSNQTLMTKAALTIDGFDMSSGGPLYVWASGSWHLFGIVTQIEGTDFSYEDTTTSGCHNTGIHGFGDANCDDGENANATRFVEPFRFAQVIDTLELEKKGCPVADEHFSCCPYEEYMNNGHQCEDPGKLVVDVMEAS